MILLPLLFGAIAAAAADRTDKPTQRYYTFEELCDKYAAREGYTCIRFGRKMMRMMSDRVEADDRELARLLDDLHEIRALTTTCPDEAFLRDAATVQLTAHYTLVSSLSEEGRTTECCLIDGGRRHPSHFLLFSHGPDEAVVLDIVGYFDVKDISRLSSIRPR